MHFGNYETNREGFKGFYRKLSDKLWKDAIDLIKYITQRGGKMNFNQLPRFKKSVNIISSMLTSLFLYYIYGYLRSLSVFIDQG